MPADKIGGTPGLVIPPAGPGGTHDMGVFHGPAGLARRGLCHRPAARPSTSTRRASCCARANGGTLDLNVHLPEPLGPDGGGSDETVTTNVPGNGRIVAGGARGPVFWTTAR